MHVVMETCSDLINRSAIQYNKLLQIKYNFVHVEQPLLHGFLSCTVITF